MKKANESKLINLEKFVVTTENGIEKGLFFRNPIQKVTFSTWGDDEDDVNLSAWKYLNDIKNPARRFFEKIIGNTNVVNNIEKWKENDNWAGFDAKILCFPLYFSRIYRELTAISTDKNENISKFHSFGFESEFCSCSGSCDKETTVIVLSNGKKIKKTMFDNFHYTYLHLFQEMIKENKSN